MNEPDVLAQVIICPDCAGSGEQERELPGFSCDLEPTSVTEDCDCCGGAGEVRLRDLPPLKTALSRC
jgi:hypothetical protein